MPRLLSFLILTLIVFSCRTKKDSYDPFNKNVKAADAKNDFEIFREILERAHPALTQYMSIEEKDRCLDSLYKTLDHDLSLRDFYKKLVYFINKTGCSHSTTIFPQALSDTLYNRKLFFPFATILVNDKLYVNSEEEYFTYGTKLLSVNGLPVKTILDSLMQYNSVEGFPRETQRYTAAEDFGIDYYTHFGAPKEFELLLQDSSGRKITETVAPVTLDELLAKKNSRYYYDATDVPYFFYVYDQDGYALLRITSFEFDSNNQQQAFEEFLFNSFELLTFKKNIKTLVVDVRENTGGDLYNCFLLHSYLAKNPFKEYRKVFSSIQSVPYTDYLSDNIGTDLVKKINDRLDEEFVLRSKTGYYIPDSLIDEWKPDPKRFNGNVYIITNSRVASAASYFTLLSRNNGNARIVGTETCGGGYSGNGFKNLEYRLPATRIRFGFPYAKMFYSFNEKKTGTGLVPDYVVPDNYTSFLKITDKQLNFIKDSLVLKKQ